MRRSQRAIGRKQDGAGMARNSNGVIQKKKKEMRPMSPQFRGGWPWACPSLPFATTRNKEKRGGRKKRCCEQLTSACCSQKKKEKKKKGGRKVLLHKSR